MFLVLLLNPKFAERTRSSDVANFGFAALVTAISLLCWLGAGAALAASEQRGFVFAKIHCAQCHAIDKSGESPLKIAPPFRTLHRKYPVENLEEALAEGISTGHRSMPEFRLEVDQIADFIAFLKTLER